MGALRTPEEIYNSFSKQHVIGRDDAIIAMQIYHNQFGLQKLEDIQNRLAVYIQYHKDKHHPLHGVLSKRIEELTWVLNQEKE